MIRTCLCAVILFSVGACDAVTQQPAFPEAEGFGRFTSGGRGGKVIEVTNLSDSGAGSLRAAISESGARTVVFRVSGTIALKSDLPISQGDLTVAGQTAPGDGICIRDFPLIIEADNVIIRYLRIRLGDETRQQSDAISCIGRSNIMIDHCSFSWGIDEVASFYNIENLTVQWCLISESLNRSIHSKGPHGYGGIWGGKGASFHHNLFAHNSSRNPRFNGSRDHGRPNKECVDYCNNVIYNWGFNSAYGGEGGLYNMVDNYYKYGPATTHKNRIVEPLNDAGRWYISGNFVFGYPNVTANNWAGGVQGKYWRAVKVDTPYEFVSITTQPADKAYELVLAHVGAVRPKRDPVDVRVIEDVRTGSARFGQGGIIDSQAEAGGWPDLKTYDIPTDGDHDGMPDSWELSNGLNPDEPLDRNGFMFSDGYTNLEHYLNELASGQ